MSSWCSFNSSAAVSAVSVLNVLSLLTGANISLKSMPSFCMIPLAKLLTLCLSMLHVPSVLMLNTHLTGTGLTPVGGSSRFRVPFAWRNALFHSSLAFIGMQLKSQGFLISLMSLKLCGLCCVGLNLVPLLRMHAFSSWVAWLISLLALTLQGASMLGSACVAFCEVASSCSSAS